MKIIVTEEQIKEIINNVYNGYLIEGANYPYGQLKNNPTPQFIAKVIKDSKGTFNDNEAWVEAAFMAIKTPDMYNKVKTALGQDPYKYAASFMDVNEKYHVQAVGVSYKLMNSGSKSQKVTVDNFPKKCPLILTVAKPGGNKTNNAPVDIFKYWGKDKNGNHKDPLLYSNGLTGTYAKVPADFGWKLNNGIYPYPTLYSQSCIDTSGQWASKQAQFGKFLKEYSDPLYNVQKSDNTSVSKSYLGNQIDPRTIMTKKEKSDRNIGKEMINFNNALIKQKELIPKYCTSPITRQQKIVNNNLKAAFNTATVSMYNLCRDFGGLWVDGVGTSEYKCRCRDMSNASLTTNLQSSTGDINIGSEVDKTQKSRNWSNADSRDMITNAVAFATAFIPVVGPFVSAGISLGNAAIHWRAGKQKEAAVDMFFALLPMLGKIPGIGKISSSVATSLGSKLGKGSGLSLQELNTLKKITQYDEVISKQMLSQLEKSSLGKIEQHIVKTAVKKTEGALVDYTGLPTRSKVKKAIANTAVGATTNLS